MKIIKLNNIWKIFNAKKQNEVQAVQGINLEIEQGDFVSIIGPSGSGKSSLMHIIGLLDKPDKGTYLLNNQEVNNLKDYEISKLRSLKIGFVFQSFNLLSRTSAINNVILPLIYQKTPNRKEIALEKLKEVGLAKRIYHKPNELSGGEQQRVAIARALAANPEIILADEPTGNLDSKSGKEIMKIFKKLNDQGKTIIIVTHDLNVAKQAKRIINLQDGKIKK
jgi:putative ABC transport system ATP-binding protein